MALSRPIFCLVGAYFEQLYMHPLRTKSATRYTRPLSQIIDRAIIIMMMMRCFRVFRARDTIQPEALKVKSVKALV